METQNGDQSNASQGTSVGDVAGGQTAGNDVAGSQGQDDQNGGVSAGDQQGTSDQTAGDANAQGDKPHEQAVPYERFKTVNEELTQIKGLIESAKTDPAARSQLAQMLGVEAQQPDAAAQPTATPFENVLKESVDPQMHDHYRKVFGAYAEEAESRFKEMLAPVMAFIGKMSLDGAYTKNPLLKEHERELADVMKKHPTLSPDEAGWHIPALREKLIKQASMSGQKKEQQRQQAINRTPVTKSGGAPGSTQQPAPKNTRGMFERAYDKLSAPA